MGHCISHITCPEGVNKWDLSDELAREARKNGGGLISPIVWHDGAPLESEEAAREWIRSKDGGWYENHAVRFYDYSKATETKKIVELAKRIAETVQARNEYRDSHSVHGFKAEFIGCPECGSKLSKTHLRGETCPLCRRDLRSQTTLDRLARYQEKISALRKQVEEQKQKQKDKAVVKWLVKYEYHC